MTEKPIFVKTKDDIKVFGFCWDNLTLTKRFEILKRTFIESDAELRSQAKLKFKDFRRIEQDNIGIAMADMNLKCF